MARSYRTWRSASVIRCSSRILKVCLLLGLSTGGQLLLTTALHGPSVYIQYKRERNCDVSTVPCVGSVYQVFIVVFVLFKSWEVHDRGKPHTRSRKGVSGDQGTRKGMPLPYNGNTWEVTSCMGGASPCGCPCLNAHSFPALH